VIGGIGLTDSENPDSDQKDSGLMGESFISIYDTKEKCARNAENWEYEGKRPCERKSQHLQNGRLFVLVRGPSDPT
jgi:hypothetical protein